MKRWTLAAVALTLTLPAAAFADRIERTLPSAPGQELEIDLRTGGAIDVRAGDDAAIHVIADRGGSDAADIELEIEGTAHGARIASRYNGGRHSSDTDVKLDVRVPKHFDVRLKTMGGDVHLEGLEGSFSGETMGGALELVSLTGKVALSTMGGEIHAERSHLDGKVSTMGGNVLIEDVEGDLKGSSMGGQVTYKNAGPVRAGGAAIDMSSMGGDLNVDQAPNGARLSTMGGNVRVRSASSYVKAETMGGDVMLDRVDGWIDAQTMGGRVTATVVGDATKGRRDVRLESKSGDLHLTVPADFDMDIDIELVYTRNSTRRYRVDSDLPLKIEESKDWESNYGTPRKVIHATGRVGTGAARIVLRTVNGDVTLTREH